MNCPKCKKQNLDEANFCSSCGTQIIKEQKTDGNKRSTTGLFIIIFLAIAVVSLVFLYVNKDQNEAVISESNTNFDSELISKISASVVYIECEDINDDEFVHSGSGTIWFDDGTILTNNHIIPQTEDELLTPEYGCLVTLPDPETGIPLDTYYADPVVLPELSEEYDLAMLEIYDVYVDEDGYEYGEYPRTFPFYDDTDLCIEDEVIKLGEPVTVFGYPASTGNYSLTLTEGIVSNFPEDSDTIIISAKMDSGNSGGLVVDKNGCWLGVPTYINFGEYENMGEIIIPEAVNELVDRYYE